MPSCAPGLFRESVAGHALLRHHRRRNGWQNDSKISKTLRLVGLREVRGVWEPLLQLLNDEGGRPNGGITEDG